MKKLFLPAVACTLWLMFTGSAAATVYPVNVSVDGGSVTGSITTDGTLGPLSTIDITSFMLTLDDPSSPPPAVLDSTTGGEVFIGGNGLNAVSDTTLLFDFGNSGAFVNFFDSANCTPVWTLRAVDSAGSTCNNISGTVNSIQTTGAAITVNESPNTTLDLEQGPVSAPEPASLAMILAGLVSMIGLRKLRF